MDNSFSSNPNTEAVTAENNNSISNLNDIKLTTVNLDNNSNTMTMLSKTSPEAMTFNQSDVAETKNVETVNDSNKNTDILPGPTVTENTMIRETSATSSATANSNTSTSGPGLSKVKIGVGVVKKINRGDTAAFNIAEQDEEGEDNDDIDSPQNLLKDSSDKNDKDPSNTNLNQNLNSNSNKSISTVDSYTTAVSRAICQQIPVPIPYCYHYGTYNYGVQRMKRGTMFIEPKTQTVDEKNFDFADSTNSANFQRQFSVDNSMTLAHPDNSSDGKIKWVNTSQTTGLKYAISTNPVYSNTDLVQIRYPKVSVSPTTHVLVSAFLCGTPSLVICCTEQSVRAFNIACSLGLKADLMIVMDSSLESSSGVTQAANNYTSTVQTSSKRFDRITSLDSIVSWLDPSLSEGRHSRPPFDIGCHIYVVEEENLKLCFEEEDLSRVKEFEVQQGGKMKFVGGENLKNNNNRIGSQLQQQTNTIGQRMSAIDTRNSKNSLINQLNSQLGIDGRGISGMNSNNKDDNQAQLQDNQMNLNYQEIHPLSKCNISQNFDNFKNTSLHRRLAEDTYCGFWIERNLRISGLQCESDYWSSYKLPQMAQSPIPIQIKPPSDNLNQTQDNSNSKTKSSESESRYIKLSHLEITGSYAIVRWNAKDHIIRNFDKECVPRPPDILRNYIIGSNNNSNRTSKNQISASPRGSILRSVSGTIPRAVSGTIPKSISGISNISSFNNSDRLHAQSKVVVFEHLGGTQVYPGNQNFSGDVNIQSKKMCLMMLDTEILTKNMSMKVMRKHRDVISGRCNDNSSSILKQTSNMSNAVATEGENLNNAIGENQNDNENDPYLLSGFNEEKLRQDFIESHDMTHVFNNLYSSIDYVANKIEIESITSANEADSDGGNNVTGSVAQPASSPSQSTLLDLYRSYRPYYNLGEYRPFILIAYNVFFQACFVMVITIFFGCYWAFTDVRFFFLGFAIQLVFFGQSIQIVLASTLNVRDHMPFLPRIDYNQWYYWGAVIVPCYFLALQSIPLGTESGLREADKVTGEDQELTPGLFGVCILSTLIAVFTTIFYLYKVEHNNIQVWPITRQLVWGVTVIFCPLFWGVLLVLLSISIVVNQNIGAEAEGLYISVVFSIAENGIVILYSSAYYRLVYLPRRRKLMQKKIFEDDKKSIKSGSNSGSNSDAIDSDSDSDEFNFKTYDINGEQKKPMTVIFAMFHSWCESARAVALVSKVIRGPRDDTSYISSILFGSLFVNIPMRAGLGRALIGQFLLSMRKCGPSFIRQSKYFQFIADPYWILPTSFSKLHDDCKFACGWSRIFIIVSIFLARGCATGNWDSFSDNAFFIRTNTLPGYEDEPDEKTTIPENFDHTVWCYNRNVLLAFTLIILMEGFEDVSLHYILLEKIEFIQTVIPRVFGRWQRDLTQKGQISGQIVFKELSNNSTSSSNSDSKQAKPIVQNDFFDGDLFHPHRLIQWHLRPDSNQQKDIIAQNYSRLSKDAVHLSPLGRRLSMSVVSRPSRQSITQLGGLSGRPSLTPGTGGGILKKTSNENENRPQDQQIEDGPESRQNQEEDVLFDGMTEQDLMMSSNKLGSSNTLNSQNVSSGGVSSEDDENNIEGTGGPGATSGDKTVTAESNSNDQTKIQLNVNSESQKVENHNTMVVTGPAAKAALVAKIGAAQTVETIDINEQLKNKKIEKKKSMYRYGTRLSLISRVTSSKSVISLSSSPNFEDVAEKNDNHTGTVKRSSKATTALEWVAFKSPNLRTCYYRSFDQSDLGVLASTSAFVVAAFLIMLGTGSTFGQSPPSEEFTERLLDMFIWYTPGGRR